jgi:hypothetical protein
VKRAVDSDNITLGEHVLELLNTATSNLSLDGRGKGLVVVVEELLAVESLETTENTLSDTSNSDGSNNLALKVVRVLGNSGNVPVTGHNLLVSGNEVTDEGENSEDNMLSNGDNVGSGDLGDGDSSVGLVGRVQVDMVGSDTSSDGELQVFGTGKALSGKVSGMEAEVCVSDAFLGGIPKGSRRNSRRGDDNLSINKLTVENGVLAVLVGGGDKSVTLRLEPLAETELILGGSEKTGNLLGVLTAVVEDCKYLDHFEYWI